MNLKIIEILKGDRVLEIDKTPVTNLDTATKSLRSASDAVLLRLVRRLRSSIHSHESKEDLSIKSNLNIMGANVSRHSGKGLSGRRTQSSGNICNGKPSNVSRLLGPCATTDSAITPTTNNKYRFCGSLPNNLDDEVLANVDAEPINNNLKGQIVKVNTANNQTHVPKKQPAPPIPTLRNINRPNVELRLQNLHVKVNNDTALCDQGYGSERSPEDEYPPGGLGFPQQGCAHQCEENVDLDLYSKYPFIKPECTFTVAITKNSRGLGLSVTGGVDCGAAWPGLIRVKRLFPNQPAASCGLLSAGDLILAANGITLTGLTNYEALEVLRTTPTTVTLTVCRLPTEILGVVSPLSDIPPPPPKRDPPCSLNLLPLITPYEDCYTGEFDIILTKVQGSLGFTLRKEDESALGHYVRALVREPALSDGRIKPGDKIIAVNDVELSPFSHEEAVQFLRQCGQEVKLRLYRDAAQTPVAALSPTESEAPVKLKPLRQEAMDMLSDLAVRKLSPVNNGGNDEYWGRSKEEWSNGGMANGTVNRKLRRMQRTTPDSECDNSYTEGSYKYVSSQVTNSESDSFSRKASIGSDDNNTNLSSNDSDPNNCNERPIRPNFLNLGSPIQTPSSRKPKFQFSLAHNAYELNNLDADVLDAPNLTYKDDVDEVDGGMDYIGNSSEEPVSMPPIPSSAFMHAKPSYQSAHPKCGTTDPVDTPKCGVDGSKGLLKWKGIVFTPEGEADDPEKVKPSILHMDGNNFEIITIEMNRGWNSRLGFSLQQGEHGETYVSAVHSDSVASRDGRLKQGDLLLRVNDENVENMTTNNVIDMLRIVRGPVCIVIARKIS